MKQFDKLGTELDSSMKLPVQPFLGFVWPFGGS